MKNLSTALFNRFSETDAGVHCLLYRLVSGQMFKERAKQKATLPYIVFHIISDVPEWTFTTEFERVRIQFDIYSSSESSSEIEDIYTALKALYDWCTLVIAGNTHVYMRRESARLSRDPTDDAWAYNVDYTILMEKN